MLKLGIARTLSARALTLLVLACMTQWSYADALSGTFVSLGERSGAILQILPAGEGKVVGRLRMALANGGDVQSLDFPVSGAANVESLIGKIERGPAQGGDVAISGTLSGNTLRVSSAILTTAMQRGSAGDYDSLVGRLTLDSAQKQQSAAKEAAVRKNEQDAGKAAASISMLLSNVADFSVNQPAIAERLANQMPQRWERNTEALQGLVRQMEQTSQPGLAAVSRRYEIMTAISKKGLDTSQALVEVTSAEKTFSGAGDVLRSGMADARSLCRSTPKVGRQSARLRQACGELPEAQAALDQATSKAGAIYADLMRLWQSAKTRDQDLSGRAVRLMAEYNGSRL
ncbi:hypothetical protein QTH91_14545 [Variovorax dokdonensis]|uniref:Uncharacterized protein n=1 Tax=Variovorax dokdonensis TaxID=344883 RepID=A0ABT7NCM4_9BURK|nr:hypothetical protein [Variovorax dokdonensis]MDM0045706.1 hypothetical protein [Variovorax dokdonensis]